MSRGSIVIQPGAVVAGVDSGRDLPDDFGNFTRGDQGPSVQFSKRDRIIDQISPHPLWVGHAGNGSDARMLHDLGIEAVVQVAAEEPPLSPPRGLLYQRFPLLDGSGNLPEFLMLAVGTVEALVRLRVPTLVCCGMGLSRSPAVAAVALAIVRDEPPDEVLRMLAACHPVDVSPGFWGEIRAVRPTQVGFDAVGAVRQPGWNEASF